MPKSLVSESMNILEDMLKDPQSVILTNSHPEPDMPDISQVNLNEGSLGLQRTMRKMRSANKKTYSNPKLLKSAEIATQAAEKTAMKRASRKQNPYFRGYHKDLKKIGVKNIANSLHKESKLQKIQELINEAQRLLNEVTGIGAGMGTTTGMIGVNMAGPGYKRGSLDFPKTYEVKKKRKKKLI